MTQVKEEKNVELFLNEILDFFDSLEPEMAVLLKGYVNDTYASLYQPHALVNDNNSTVTIESVFSNKSYETHEYIKLERDLSNPNKWKLSLGSYQAPIGKTNGKIEVHEVTYFLADVANEQGFPLISVIHNCYSFPEPTGIKRIDQTSEFYKADFERQTFKGDYVTENTKVVDEKGNLLNLLKEKNYRINDRSIPFHKSIKQRRI